MSPGPGIYARNRTSGVVLTPPRPRITIGARVVTRQGGACGWRGPNQPHRCIRWRPPLGEGFYENIAAVALAFATVATVGTGSVLAFSTTSFGAALLRNVGHHLVCPAR